MNKELEQLYLDKIDLLRERVDYLEGLITRYYNNKSKLRKLAISCGVSSKHKMDRPNKLGKVKDLLENEREV
jgi:hypothetical protein